MKSFLILGWMFFLAVECSHGQLATQAQNEAFDIQIVQSKQWIRDVRVAQSPEDGQSDAWVVLSRDQSFPNWTHSLSTIVKQNNQWALSTLLEVPAKSTYWSLLNWDQQRWVAFQTSSSLHVAPWPAGQTIGKMQKYALPQVQAYASAWGPVWFDATCDTKNPQWVCVHAPSGQWLFDLQTKKWISSAPIPTIDQPVGPTSQNVLPPPAQPWFSSYYRKAAVQSVQLGEKRFWAHHWMDTLYLAQQTDPSILSEKNFGIVSDESRNQSYGYTHFNLLDINADGSSDLLLNHIQGTGALFRSKAYVALFDPVKAQWKKIQTIPFPKKQTSMAFVHDVNANGQMDVAVVSTDMSAWAMIKVLTRRQVSVDFKLYEQQKKSPEFNWKKPTLTRTVDFDFSLRDFFVDGMMPTLQGDYNGDGKPDILYARNPQELTILLQENKPKASFPKVPSSLISVNVPRQHAIADVTGNGKDDILLFDTLPPAHQAMTLMINKGKL